MSRKVKLIFRKNNALLVEFYEDGMPTRVSIPSDKAEVVDNGKSAIVLPEDLEQGIAYGIPWEHVLEEMTISPELLAKSLRESGIWTSDDAIKNPDGIRHAVLGAVGLTVSGIRDFAKNYNKE